MRLWSKIDALSRFAVKNPFIHKALRKNVRPMAIFRPYFWQPVENAKI